MPQAATVLLPYPYPSSYFQSQSRTFFMYVWGCGVRFKQEILQGYRNDHGAHVSMILASPSD